MNSSIVICPFVDVFKDQMLDLILSIQQKEFSILITREEQPDLERVAEFYQTGIGNFWVAQKDASIVGTIALKDIDNQQVALRKMFVHPDYRGKMHGVAQRLLDQAREWSKKHSVTDIFLGTTSKFLAAHRFYEKNDFSEINKSELPNRFPIMAVDSKFYHYRMTATAI